MAAGAVALRVASSCQQVKAPGQHQRGVVHEALAGLFITDEQQALVCSWPCKALSSSSLLQFPLVLPGALHILCSQSHNSMHWECDLVCCTCICHACGFVQRIM